DAARRARQQKKDAPKPKKVFTNEDVSPRSSSSATPTAAPAAAGSVPSASDAKDDASGQARGGDAASGDKSAAPVKNDEATWKAKFRDERAKLSDAERELDILQREA